jgi:hypothetical protein
VAQTINNDGREEMKIKIKMTIQIPEVPSEIDIESGTLRDLVVRILTPLHCADEVVDPLTGEIKADGFYQVALNDVPYYALPKGLDTGLHDGDTLLLSLMVIGGG